GQGRQHRGDRQGFAGGRRLLPPHRLGEEAQAGGQPGGDLAVGQQHDPGRLLAVRRPPRRVDAALPALLGQEVRGHGPSLVVVGVGTPRRRTFQATAAIAEPTAVNTPVPIARGSQCTASPGRSTAAGTATRATPATPPTAAGTPTRRTHRRHRAGSRFRRSTTSYPRSATRTPASA